jgi:SulP family sulfate permease
MEPVFKPKLLSIIQHKLLTKEQIQKDIFSGIIVGIVAIPLAIAFAVASGVSPDKGFITAIVAGFLISVLGGSRVQIGGPTGAFIVIVYGILQQYGLDGLLISTILAGVILIAFGLLRLGVILRFIPHPLIVGFTSGIALVIFSTQIKDALGLTLTATPAEFIEKWQAYFRALSTVNYWALGITVVTIFITVGFKKISAKIPGSFVAIILVTATVAIFKLPVHTIETVYGNIPNSFSIDIPPIQWENIHYYFRPAFTIAFLGAIESLLSAVVSDGMISSNHRSNTELIAQGVANIVTPFFGGIPATGAIARTATNVKNGGRTPIAGIVHAITLLLIMLFFGNYAKLIPMSCLAGILIVVSYNMSEWRNFVSILKGIKNASGVEKYAWWNPKKASKLMFALYNDSSHDAIILVATFTLTVLVDLTVAIEIGMVMASLLFMKRMSSGSKIIDLAYNKDEFDKDLKIPKGMDIFEISGPFFFAAAKTYMETLKEVSDNSKLIIIRMRHVPFIDATGVHSFTETIHILQKRKVKIVLSGVNSEVYKELQTNGVVDLIGKDHIFSAFDEAYPHATALLTQIAE